MRPHRAGAFSDLRGGEIGGLTLERLPLARAAAMAAGGEIVDAKSVAALLRAASLVGASVVAPQMRCPEGPSQGADTSYGSQMSTAEAPSQGADTSHGSLQL